MTGARALLRRDLPALRSGREAEPDLVERRRSIAELSGPGPVQYIDLGGLRCAVAATAWPRAVIVHCHGGGYRHGSAQGWAAFAGRLASATNTGVLIPDYSLAPEHPFPAAIHDLVGVVAALVAEPPLPLILSGDSAGGGLALAVASILTRPLPFAGIALISPWLDLRLRADSYTRCAATDAVFSRQAAAASAEAYLQGAAPDHPLASPLLGPLEGLPPVQVQVGAGEVLLDDSLALVERFAAAGVRCGLHVEPDAPHVWPVALPDLPASARALNRIAHFMDEVVRPSAI